MQPFPVLQHVVEGCCACQVEHETPAPYQQVFDGYGFYRAVFGAEREFVVYAAVDNAPYHKPDGGGEKRSEGVFAHAYEYPCVEHEADAHIGPRRDLRRYRRAQESENAFPVHEFVGGPSHG